MFDTSAIINPELQTSKQHDNIFDTSIITNFEPQTSKQRDDIEQPKSQNQSHDIMSQTPKERSFSGVNQSLFNETLGLGAFNPNMTLLFSNNLANRTLNRTINDADDREWA